MPGRPPARIKRNRRLIRGPCILQRNICWIVDPCVVDHGVKSFTLLGVAAAKHNIVALSDLGLFGWWGADRDIKCGATAKWNQWSQFERNKGPRVGGD